eukprot:6864687-Pyramimonas_sp.AAC.1
MPQDSSLILRLQNPPDTRYNNITSFYGSSSDTRYIYQSRAAARRQAKHRRDGRLQASTLPTN